MWYPTTGSSDNRCRSAQLMVSGLVSAAKVQFSRDIFRDRRTHSIGQCMIIITPASCIPGERTSYFHLQRVKLSLRCMTQSQTRYVGMLTRERLGLRNVRVGAGPWTCTWGGDNPAVGRHITMLEVVVEARLIATRPLL